MFDIIKINHPRSAEAMIKKGVKVSTVLFKQRTEIKGLEIGSVVQVCEDGTVAMVKSIQELSICVGDILPDDGKYGVKYFEVRPFDKIKFREIKGVELIVMAMDEGFKNLDTMNDYYLSKDDGKPMLCTRITFVDVEPALG